jgi:3-hydroxy-9,10-secoandrosta-1,3,5(10)-triene-9,17-dione monooxygenase reductase component
MAEPSQTAGPQASVGSDSFRRAMSALGTGVTVVTTRAADGTPVGMTANSFNSVSLDPPLVLWSVRLASHSFPAFRESPRFAVGVLRESQQALAQQFARPSPDKFDGVELHDGLGGVPLIAGCAAYFECAVTAVHVAGDHAIFIGRVERCDEDDTAAPLIFHRGRKLQHPLDGRLPPA